jgi:hypothetical protein
MKVWLPPFTIGLAGYLAVSGVAVASGGAVPKKQDARFKITTRGLTIP